MSTEITIYLEARNELSQILDAGAKALKPAGRELMPIKREMLGDIPTNEADLILDCCNLLFAAILSYEAGQWTIDHANNPVDLISARIEAGRARGVIEALFFGPTRFLLSTAMDRAPIAYYSLSEASPDLKLIDRTIGKPV